MPLTFRIALKYSDSLLLPNRCNNSAINVFVVGKSKTEEAPAPRNKLMCGSLMSKPCPSEITLLLYSQPIRFSSDKLARQNLETQMSINEF